jgi:DNA-binding transcriptional ArsR family regulator
MEIDSYVLEALLPDLVGHDRHPSAFLTYLYLWRRRNDAGVELTLTEISEGTGLSKRAVQSALRRLEARRLVSIERPSTTSPGRYTVHRPWAERARAPWRNRFGPRGEPAVVAEIRRSSRPPVAPRTRRSESARRR